MQERSNNGSFIVNIVEHDTKDGSLSRICLGGPSVARSGSGPTNLFRQYASGPLLLYDVPLSTMGALFHVSISRY